MWQERLNEEQKRHAEEIDRLNREWQRKMSHRENQLRKELVTRGQATTTTFNDRWKGVNDWLEDYRQPMKALEAQESNQRLVGSSTTGVSCRGGIDSGANASAESSSYRGQVDRSSPTGHHSPWASCAG